MTGIFKIAFFGLLVGLAQSSFATGACPYITNESWSALDAAIPCTNFPSLRNPHTQLQSELRPSLQQGVFSELVRRNKAEAICRENAYNQKLADAGEMDRIYDAIATRFAHYRGAFRRLREEGARDAELTRISTAGTAGDLGGNAFAGVQNYRLGTRDAERDRKRDLLIARIPYGFWSPSSSHHWQAS